MSGEVADGGGVEGVFGEDAAPVEGDCGDGHGSKRTSRVALTPKTVSVQAGVFRKLEPPGP